MTALGPPSAELQLVFDQQLNLCDALERIADSLPHRLNHALCMEVANSICPLIRRVHESEEALMFPRIAAAYDAGNQLVQQLRLEHVEDECFAEEIQIELMQMTTGQPVLTPEATGYMLRGFFEGLRRHVRHERELVAALGPTSPIASGSGSSAAH